MRKIIGIVLILLLVVAASPWLAGMKFESTYQQLVAFYNLHGDVNIQILDYHRHWFSSTAKIRIKILNVDARQLSQEMGLDDSRLDFIVDQQIQHGPLIYRYAANLPSHFGLAAVHNIVQASPAIQDVVKKSPLNLIILLDSDGLVTFSGNYFKHIKTAPFQFNYSARDIHFQCQGMQSNLWVFPQQDKLRSQIILSGVMIKTKESTLVIPSLMIYFDQRIADSGLWLGKISALTPEMIFEDVNGKSIRILGFDFHGKVSEKSGKIFDTHSLNINSISFGDHGFGPLRLQLSASGLSAKAIANMAAASRKILREGELYRSQLKLKMSSMLPRVFAKKATISLDKLEIISPQGSFQMKGDITWPFSEASASDAFELMQDANANGDAKISKLFLDQLIDYASSLPYFRSISDQRRLELIEMQKNLELANQRNFLFLSLLVQQNLLSENSAILLLGLQKNDESLSHYFEAVRTLLLQREISRQLSYLLFWQYLAVKNRSADLDQAFAADQETVKQQMHEQLATWIKQGFIKRDQNAYIIKIEKTNGVMKVSGKEI
jgi:uncharacterized protein YdgA (DUF945 family)